MLDLHAKAWATLNLDWAGFLTHIVQLPALPSDFPLPSTEPVCVEIDLADGGLYTLRAATDFDLEHELTLGGVTLGTHCHLEFSTTLDGTALAQAFTSSASRLRGNITLGASLRLPSLPMAGPLQLYTGDADGWLHVSLAVMVDTDGTLALSATLRPGDFELALYPPGATPDQPLLRASLDSLELALVGLLREAPAMTLNLTGGLVITPVALLDDVPFAYQWQQMYSAVTQPLEIDCTLTLAVTPDAMSASLQLRNAEVELRPFAAMAGLSTGMRPTGGDHEIPFDLPLSFRWRGVRARLARDMAESSLELQAGFSIGDVEGEAWISITGREFRIGIGKMEIPLVWPRFPLTRVEFDRYYGHPALLEQDLEAQGCTDRDTDPARSAACQRLQAQRFLLQSFDTIPASAAAAGRPMSVEAQARYRAWLELFITALDLATSVSGNGASALFRITPRVRERLALDGVPADILERLAPLGARIAGAQRFADALRQQLGIKRHNRYGALIAERARIHGASMVAMIDGVEHILLENMTLAIDHLELTIPYASPNNLRASGGVKFTAFSEPLGSSRTQGQLEVELEAGISPDMVYFTLKSADGRVPLPDVERYRGGSLRFAQFLIGIGYTKRSLALAFAGEVVLPEQLVRDLDTSEVTVFGIRLPVRTQLAFRLDLVPVPAPSVTIIVPVFQFNLDLRRGPAGLRDPERCLPEWDGLQFIVGEQFRLALKHIAFSPMFGFLPSLNWVLGGDLMIGDDHNGLGIVIDEWMQIDAFFTGTAIKGVLPGFCDDTPFVNDCCVDVRVAGFCVHFHMQRPFPSVSPLALPELFALLADPANYPINPRGELANCLRLSINNTGITLPENLLALFPSFRAAAVSPVTETVNLGTFITVTQQVARVMAPLFQEAIARIKAAAEDPRALARPFTYTPLNPRELLRLLPAPLQRLDTAVSFAGFDGRAVLVLLTKQEARAALRARAAGGAPPPARLPLTGLAPGQVFSEQDMLSFHPRLADSSAASPPSPGLLLADPLFTAFTEADLRLSAVEDVRDGVLIGAHVQVLPGQSLDFIGYISADGRFALVAALAQAPLTLRVAGIDIPLPFMPSTEGRVTLRGEAGRNGMSARLTARGRAEWKILPGMIEATIEKAMLELASHGSFALRGDLALALFDGRLKITGQIDVAPTHALVSGRLTLDQGPLRFNLRGTGSLGPLHHIQGGRYEGARMDMTAVGDVWLSGEPMSGVRTRLTGERLELQGQWRPKAWALFGTPATLGGDLACHGIVWFPKEGPAWRVEAQGRVDLRWDPERSTPGDLAIEGSGLFERNAESSVLAMNGTLFWLGRRWASGSLRVDGKGIQLSGSTTWTIEIPPEGIALLPNLPRLVLRLDVNGRFNLDTTGVITHAEFDGHWFLGARLNDNTDQLLPLAAGGRHIVGTSEVTLIDLSRILLVPGGLTVPTLKPNTDSKSWIGIGRIGDDPAVRISTPSTAKTIKLHQASLSIGGGGFKDFFGNEVKLSIDSPPLPELSKDNLDGEAVYFYPLLPTSQSVAVAWPYVPDLKISLVIDQATLAVRLVAGGEDHPFPLH